MLPLSKAILRTSARTLRKPPKEITGTRNRRAMSLPFQLDLLTVWRASQI